MADLSVAEDIVPIGEFRAHSGRFLDRLRETGQPVVITQNGRPAGVVISPADFDTLQRHVAYRRSIQQGLAEADAGETMSTDELKQRLAARRKTAAT